MNIKPLSFHLETNDVATAAAYKEQMDKYLRRIYEIRSMNVPQPSSANSNNSNNSNQQSVLQSQYGSNNLNQQSVLQSQYGSNNSNQQSVAQSQQPIAQSQYILNDSNGNRSPQTSNQSPDNLKTQNLGDTQSDVIQIESIQETVEESNKKIQEALVAAKQIEKMSGMIQAQDKANQKILDQMASKTLQEIDPEEELELEEELEKLNQT